MTVTGRSVNCPHCGYRWASHATGTRTRCGACHAAVAIRPLGEPYASPALRAPPAGAQHPEEGSPGDWAAALLGGAVIAIVVAGGAGLWALSHRGPGASHDGGLDRRWLILGVGVTLGAGVLLWQAQRTG